MIRTLMAALAVLVCAPAAQAERFGLPSACEGIATIVYEDCAIAHAAQCGGDPDLVTLFQIRQGALAQVETRWGGVLAEEVRDAAGYLLVRFAMDYRYAVDELRKARAGERIDWSFRRYAGGENVVWGDQSFELAGERTLDLATGPLRVQEFRVEASLAATGETSFARRFFAPSLGLEVGRDLSHTRDGFTSRVVDRPVAAYRPGDAEFLQMRSAICGATTRAPAVLASR